MDIALTIVFIGITIFLSHYFSSLYIKTKIPDVLFLFLIGILIGPILKIVQPEHFGSVGKIFTTITLVFILFEGSMGLCIESIKMAWKGTAKVSVYNFFISTLVVGIIGFSFTSLGLIASLMLGSIIGGTSSIVVMPLVKQLIMNKTQKSILILESAFTDLLCIVFALAFLETLKFGDFHLGNIIGNIISTFFLGGLIGIAGGLVWSFLLEKVRTLENSMFMTPAFVFVVFGISELLGYSGAISALTFGFTISNLNLFSFKLIEKYIVSKPISLNIHEKSFQSEIVFLLKTFFFIYMGISMQFANLLWLFTGLIITLVLFVFRIYVVKFGAPANTTKKDAVLMAVILPKGLAAAVLASIPLHEGVRGGDFIQGITFSVIIFSILITSILIFLLERKPRLSQFYSSFFTNFKEEEDSTYEEIYKTTPTDNDSDENNTKK